MSILNKRYVTSRWNDFWGWINVRVSSDSIDDKQCVLSNNMVSEWNKIVTINWYVQYITHWAWVSKWQAIALYDKYVLSIHNRNLYVYNASTWVTYTKTNAVANAVDIYQIITTKSLSTWYISIILINSNILTTEDIVWYEFNDVSFTNVTFVWLINKNFKAWAFHSDRLFLWGNPKYPSTLYYSQSASATSPTLIYDFSWYNSNARAIWDWEPIVKILSNIDELYVVKTNWFHKKTWEFDNWTSFAFVFVQQSATWALNPHCVIPVEKDILYFDWINMRRISYEANMAALSDNSISKEILPIIWSLPQNQSANATMYYSYPFVKLFLRDKFSSDNTVWILYNVVDKSFSTQTWVNVTQWIGWFVSNKRTAYFVTSQTSTIYQDNFWVTYNSWNIDSSYKSKRYVLWDGVDYKRVTQVELYGEMSTWFTVSIDIYVNWVVIDTRELFFEEVIQPTTWSSPFWNSLFWAFNEDGDSSMRSYVARYEYFNDGRDFQFWIRSNWQWRFELHWLNIIYKSIKAYDNHY